MTKHDWDGISVLFVLLSLLLSAIGYGYESTGTYLPVMGLLALALMIKIVIWTVK